MTTINRLTKGLLLDRRPAAINLRYGLIAIWMLVMILLPIAKWILGREIIPEVVTFALLIQFSVVLLIVASSWGLRRALITLAIVAVATWAVEFVGSSTGFPFGEYDYTNALQPQIGHVPLLIPLAWFMMLPSAWAIAETLTRRQSRWAYIAVSALTITAWDLFLDPQMVDWGFWVWANPEGYFGIPWSNYGGWLLTGVLVTLLVRPYRFKLPLSPLILVYGIVWFLQSIGLAFFWGQPGPAIVGSLAMGFFLLLSVVVYRRQTA